MESNVFCCFIKNLERYTVTVWNLPWHVIITDFNNNNNIGYQIHTPLQKKIKILIQLCPLVELNTTSSYRFKVVHHLSRTYNLVSRRILKIVFWKYDVTSVFGRVILGLVASLLGTSVNSPAALQEMNQLLCKEAWQLMITFVQQERTPRTKNKLAAKIMQAEWSI